MITTPVNRMSLQELARREPCEDEFREGYMIADHRLPMGPRDMSHIQTLWDAYLKNFRDTCSPQFWDFFLKIHSFPVNIIDTVLTSARKTFIAKQTPEWKRFPPTRRAVLDKLNKLQNFWPRVLHQTTMDLTSFALPSGTKSLVFKFVDPVWAWIIAARKQHPLDLHWKPVAQNPCNTVYGGGIQYGECFRQACATCPPGAYPMCFALHWDGTSGGGISSTPICIGVSNTNSASADTQFCIGYMPMVPDDKRPEFSKLPASTTLKFYIRQQCCIAILRVLESTTAKGVICRLPNSQYTEVERWLFPRLTAMNFDQPEAQLFFGSYY